MGRKWPQASERHLQPRLCSSVAQSRRSRVRSGAGSCEMSARVHAGVPDVHRRSAAVTATPSRAGLFSPRLVGVFFADL